MSRPHILIMNGPNLNALGVRQPDIYGTKGLKDIPALVKTFVDTEVCLSFFQSNSEGGLIDRLEAAYHMNNAYPDDVTECEERIDGIVFNAGAYTHTSLAVADCLAWIGIPCVEVHVSNIWARDEAIRQQSYMGKHVIGVISGFGLASYALGVQALVHHIKNAAS